jgi:hypothetical protein
MPGLVKAGQMVAAGGGNGVLTDSGRNYPFQGSGLRLDLPPGIIGRLKIWAFIDTGIGMARPCKLFRLTHD